MNDYLTQHWKMEPKLRPGDMDIWMPEVRTLTNDGLICRTEGAHARELAAHIVKTHNESLIHPDQVLLPARDLLKEISEIVADLDKGGNDPFGIKEGYATQLREATERFKQRSWTPLEEG